MFYEFKISTTVFIRGWRRFELSVRATAKISVSLKMALNQAKTGGFERNF